MSVKTIAEILQAEAKRRGVKDMKALAEDNDLPYELFRKVVAEGHVPKDATLRLYAGQLRLDFGMLVVTAAWQRSPVEARPFLERLASKLQRERLPQAAT